MAGNDLPKVDQDWTYDVAERIDSVVGTIRDKTTVPATLAARGIVYGVVAAVLGVAFFFLFIETVVRTLYLYLPIQPLSRRVWIVDAVAAAIFLGIGAFFWRMRRPKIAST